MPQGLILPAWNGLPIVALNLRQFWRTDMLKWAFIFLIVGLVAGLLGFGGIGGAFVGIAKFLFFLAIAIFVVFLVLGIAAGKKIVD
jgi:uncharacterized membrane protein YtjA (UPF0391 family)